MSAHSTNALADLIRSSAAEQAAALAAGEVSSRELTQAHLDRIAAVDGAVGAFLNVDAECALSQADAADAARKEGQATSELTGVPVAVKDLIVTRGQVTTAASRILEGWVPPYDATLVRNLRAARTPILGKTNLDEFAMGGSTEHSAFGRTANPWDLGRIPGGSSGGSAAAVGAYEAPVAVGTDTGGSIRQPAAVTGTVGVKPTYGTVSRFGVIAMASSLDTPGPMARTVLDTALLHDVIASHDPLDSTSLPDAPRDMASVVRAAQEGRDLTGLRVGVISELDGGEGYHDGVVASFHAALELLEAAGAQVETVSLPHLEYALDAYYLIMPAEASSNLARYDGMRYGLRVEPRHRRDRHGGHPRGGLRRRGQAPHHPGHPRAVGRLLRRLLRLGPEGAHSRAARLRRRLGQGGHPRLAHRSGDGLPLRGEGRPAGDVQAGRDHDPGQPRGGPRHEPALGPER